MAAAEAWALAEQNGQTLRNGETARRSSSSKVGKDDLIVAPRDYFAKLFEVGAVAGCHFAEKNGQVAKQGNGGPGRSNTPKVGGMITAPRDHFARLFEVGKTYVEQSRVVLAERNGKTASRGEIGRIRSSKVDDLIVTRATTSQGCSKLVPPTCSKPA